MGDQQAFEAIQFVEPDPATGHRGGPIETNLGSFATEADAVAVARVAWRRHRAQQPRVVAWWIVRVPGEPLARWIADSASDVERVLDLRTQSLVDLHR